MKTCGIINPIVTRFEDKPNSFFRHVEEDMLEILQYLVPKYGYTTILTSPDSKFNEAVFTTAKQYGKTTDQDLLVAACLPTAPNETSRVYTPSNTIITNSATPEENHLKLIVLCDELLILANANDLRDSTKAMQDVILHAQKRNVTLRSIPYTIENDAIRLHF